MNNYGFDNKKKSECNERNSISKDGLLMKEVEEEFTP